jgi:hypothetical protein
MKTITLPIITEQRTFTIFNDSDLEKDINLLLDWEVNPQFVVLYNTIEGAENFANNYPGAMLYANLEVSIRNRILASKHRFNHVFSFAMADGTCTESYLNELAWIGKYLWKEMPGDKVTFIYINAKNYREFAHESHWEYVAITEFKAGRLIEV